MNAADINIIRIKQLPIEDIQPLLEESQAQGFEFLKWLIRDYLDASNSFSQPGEALFGVYKDQNLIAIGGLNRDPYSPEESIGRVRRVYVLSSWRRKGIGKLLVQRIIDEARGHFKLLTLRTFDEDASKFYCALGFQTGQGVSGATHIFALKN